MNASTYPTGGSSCMEFAWFRWGGGALPGRTHVFSNTRWTELFGSISIQCVVDDFGNLVEVPA